MIYHCYLDDSADANEKRMMVCGGLVGKREEWLGFSRLWNARLAQNELQYFKSSECRMLQGEFSKYHTADYPPPKGREAANSVREDLKSLIRDYDGIGWFGICLPIEDWKQYCEDGAVDQLTDPYHRLLESVMVYVVKEGFRASPSMRNSRVVYVHDLENECPTYKKLYDAFCKLNPKTAKYSAGFSCLDDKSCPALQAADLVANYSLGLAMDWLRNGRRRNGFVEMQENLGFLKIWDPDYMRGVRDHERRRKEKLHIRTR